MDRFLSPAYPYPLSSNGFEEESCTVVVPPPLPVSRVRRSERRTPKGEEERGFDDGGG